MQQSSPHSADSLKAFYRPELDSLRFFAVLAVFWHHLLPKNVGFYAVHHYPLLLQDSVWAGALGVQLFFCLSAYLITELLLREKEQSGVTHLKLFYLRRILRIWPLYFLVLSLCVAARLVFPDEVVRPGMLAAFLVLMGNWGCIFLGNPTTFMAPLWSISVEEQFYLAWPAFLRRHSQRRRTVTAACLLVFVGVASRYWAVHYAADPRTFVWNSTVTQLDPIGAGILISVLLRHRLPVISTVGRVAMCGGGVAAWLMAGRLWERFQLSMPLATIGAVLMLLSFLGWDARIWKNRRLVKLGIVSYGIYVYQAIVLEVCRSVIFRRLDSVWRFGLFASVSLAITIGLALLSYEYFERPFLVLKQRLAVIRSRPV